MGATHLFQEGLLLPPLLASRAGVANPAVEKIIAANVRDPDLFFGDMRAQIGVTHLGVERLATLARQVGVITLLEAYGELLNQGERSLRNHLRSWPDGSSRAEAFMDSDGTPGGPPVKLVVAVTVDGDNISFDLSESDDQAAGPVNLTPCYTDTGIFFALVSLTNPEFGYNDGMRRAVSVNRRPGSVLDPAFPAPVGAAQSVKQRFNDLCFEALCHFVPERAIAHSGGSGGTLGISWRAASSDGARSLQYEVFGSGMGAMAGRDGVSGVGVYTSNLAMTPIEILESMYPVRVRRFELAPDSGGPGTWRGGLSYRREYEALEPAGVRRRGERAHFPGKGVRGGWPGDVAHVWIERHDAAIEEAPVAGSYDLERGDRMRIQGAGAGGFGDPFARDVTAVLADIEAGYVSIDAAKHSYGVVVNADGTVEIEATAALRALNDATHGSDLALDVDVAGTGVDISE
jgi:N-methylhydantoinase B